MTSQIGVPKPPSFYDNVTEHLRQIADYIKATGDRANATLTSDGTEAMTGPLGLAPYTEATPSDTRPSSGQRVGDLIYATDVDEVQFWNGSIWGPV